MFFGFPKEVFFMMSNFLTVGQQVLILFVLIGIGYVCSKKNLINGIQAKGMTNLVMYIVTPSVMIHSFQRSFDKKLFFGLVLAILAALLIHTVLILLARICLHDKRKEREKVYRFSAIFSNCGFMSLPLQAAILGDIGTFYGSAYIAVFNIIAWTYGIALMGGNDNSSGERKSLFTFKSLLLNPGILGVVIGLILFFASIRLPEILAMPVSYMAALNTPLPMIIIGYHLSQADLGRFLKEKNQYITFLLRLIIVPLLTVFALYFLHVPSEVAIATVIATSAPTAALCTMFADRFSLDTRLSATIVSLSTILSIITMPFIIGLAQGLMQ